MNAVVLLVGSTFCFLLAYFLYSKLLAKLIGIKANRPTPAHTCGDGIDYVPAHPAVLFGHHFASIAGAGPIVGPILAAEFGWGAVVLWVILGCIFVGSMHDMAALYLSVRNKGCSIATVIAKVLGKPGKIIFLLFCWSTLILVCAEFTRLVAATFSQNPAVATSSLLFIAEAVLFGIAVYRFRLPIGIASCIFVPIMFGCVWLGTRFPINLQVLGIAPDHAQTFWILVLLAYCFLASTLPVWLLLQPRDYLNSYLLYAMMALGFIGVFFANPSLNIPAFTGWTVIHGTQSRTLFPFLFVTIACGACSGFHALVASGTTAKQLSNETHIRPVAYGGMLLEGVLAILSIIAVAAMASPDFAAAMKNPNPVALIASGIAGFCTALKIPFEWANIFISLSIAAFLMTSVDTATRLARFTWQELFDPSAGASGEAAKPRPAWSMIFSTMYVATGIVIALVALLLLGDPATAKSLWHIFASSNQLLAALTLLTASLWLIKRRRPCFFTAIPMLFMFAASGYALFSLMRTSTGVLRVACVILFLMAIALLVLAGTQHRVWLKRR